MSPSHGGGSEGGIILLLCECVSLSLCVPRHVCLGMDGWSQIYKCLNSKIDFLHMDVLCQKL